MNVKSFVFQNPLVVQVVFACRHVRNRLDFGPLREINMKFDLDLKVRAAQVNKTKLTTLFKTYGYERTR